MKTRPGLFRSNSLALAVLAASLWPLASCQSPLQQDPMDQTWGRYADSILTRSLADGSLQNMPLNTPTQNQGVRELSRVDVGAATDAAITPAGATTLPGAAPTETLPLAASQPASTQPTTQVSQAPATLGLRENTYSLSLQEAIQRALRHNLDIKVEAYNPGIREARIVEALAPFDPVFSAQSQFTNQDRPPVESTGNGVNWNNNAAIRQLLPSGATVQAGLGDIYRDFQSPSFGIPESSHEANLNLSVAQPLLRGFGSTVTQANLYLAQKDYQISLATFRRQVIDSVSKVEEAYDNLILAAALVDIQERLLAQTGDTYTKTKAREGVDATNVEVSQARAAVEARRAELVRAYANVRNASDRLKTLMNDPELDIRSNVMLIPTDKPIDTPLVLNIPEQVATALRQRTELQEAKLQVQRADIVIDAAKNDLLPKLDLTIGTQSSSQQSGLDEAFNHTVNSAKFIDYQAGLKLEIPIGNRGAEAVLRRRNLERRQAITQMLNIAQQVVLDVKLQLRDMLTSYQEVQAREAARVAAGQELEALTQRERVERLSPEFLRLKLDSQQRLANAEIQEAQAMVSYTLAIMRLEQSKGTLLEYNRIAIGPAPEQVTDKGKIRFLGQTYDLGR